MTNAVGRRIEVVDDDPADRKHVQSVLTASGYEVGVHGDSDTFLAGLESLQAALVLLDLRMPGMGGLEMLKRLSVTRPDIPVIMVSGRGDIRSAVKAIKAGAADFLEKPIDPEELIATVDRVSKLAKGAATAQRPGLPVDVWTKISTREAEVLERLLKGLRNKQVAHELQIAERTVETHRANMMKRLGVTSFADLLRLTIASGERPRR